METAGRAEKNKGTIRKRILLAIPILLSAVMLTYPFICDYVNSHNAQSTIKLYQQSIDELDEEENDILLMQACQYNTLLAKDHIELTDAFGTEDYNPYDLIDADGISYDYDEMLSVDDSGVMAYLEIPEIRVYLPIYHGTSDSVLQTAVGHLEGSSLPIGGEGTHSVICGHTGLQNARIFSDLTELQEGDYFFIYVLGESLAYCVDQILVTDPYDVSALQIEDGMDYVTLVTCTPYGVNSHRLLVRGVRTDYEEAEKAENNTQTVYHSSQWMRQYITAFLIGIAILAFVILLLQIVRIIRKK